MKPILFAIFILSFVIGCSKSEPNNGLQTLSSNKGTLSKTESVPVDAASVPSDEQKEIILKFQKTELAYKNQAIRLLELEKKYPNGFPSLNDLVNYATELSITNRKVDDVLRAVAAYLNLDGLEVLVRDELLAKQNAFQSFKTEVLRKLQTLPPYQPVSLVMELNSQIVYAAIELQTKVFFSIKKEYENFTSSDYESDQNIALNTFIQKISQFHENVESELQKINELIDLLSQTALFYDDQGHLKNAKEWLQFPKVEGLNKTLNSYLSQLEFTQNIVDEFSQMLTQEMLK